MSMSAARNRKRPVAPKASTPAEVPATPAPVKAPFWKRAKATVVKTAKRVATFVKRTVSRVSSRVKPVAKRAWTVALRPVFRGVIAGVGACFVLVGAFVAPVATALTLVAGAALFFALGRLVRALEEGVKRGSRFARVGLSVLETIGRGLVVMFYALGALLTIALSLTSWPFAIFTMLILPLAYFDVRGAGTIALLVYCALSGAWALGLVWLLWRFAVRTRVRVEERAAAVHAHEHVWASSYNESRREGWSHEEATRHANAAVARGAEEVADLVEYEAKPEQSWADTWQNDSACAGCGTTKGALRVRSNDVPFVTAGTGVGKPGKASTDMLCSACYDAECEDVALSMTGVSLNKRSVLVQLNAVGRATLPEVEKSKTDPTNLFWAPTAWWRDRRGHMHDRQWDCFAGGESVATVVYDHQRRVYRASVLGLFKGTKTSETQAKRLATDTLMDEGNAVARMTEALDEVSGGETLDTALSPA